MAVAEPCRGAFCKLRSFRRGKQGPEHMQHTFPGGKAHDLRFSKALGMAFFRWLFFMSTVDRVFSLVFFFAVSFFFFDIHEDFAQFFLLNFQAFGELFGLGGYPCSTWGYPLGSQ